MAPVSRHHKSVKGVAARSAPPNTSTLVPTETHACPPRGAGGTPSTCTCTRTQIARGMPGVFQQLGPLYRVKGVFLLYKTYYLPFDTDNRANKAAKQLCTCQQRTPRLLLAEGGAHLWQEPVACHAISLSTVLPHYHQSPPCLHDRGVAALPKLCRWSVIDAPCWGLVLQFTLPLLSQSSAPRPESSTFLGLAHVL